MVKKFAKGMAKLPPKAFQKRLDVHRSKPTRVAPNGAVAPPKKQGEAIAYIKILGPVDCYPDGFNRRTYFSGEVHEIGSELMPKALADVLLGKRELDWHPSFIPTRFDRLRALGVKIAEEVLSDGECLTGGRC